MSGVPVVRVRGLNAWAGERSLVDDVSFDLSANRVTALVGHSGSGKTTTSLALLGEHRPGVRLDGDVRVAGLPVVGSNDGPPEEEIEAARARVRGGMLAYLPQNPGGALNPARRIGSVLSELARLHRDGTGDPVADALRVAQLPADRGLRRRFPHRFSGGQRQRVALAQAVICDPRVIVLDEPTTGLDTVTKREVLAELRVLAATGTALLLVTHDMDAVATLADDVVVLEDGRLCEQGPTASVLDVPASAGTRRVLGLPIGGTRGSGRERSAGHLAPAGTAAYGPPLIEARNVSASYRRSGRRSPVLADVTLTARSAGCVGVVGVSGSGKTTLARILAGLHAPDGGAVRLDGVRLPKLSRRGRDQLRRVQYVWQEIRGSFDERRPVLDQVARTAVRLRGLTPAAARTQAAELLERFEVAPRTVVRRPGDVSGGELQRAAIARALLAEPDVLICDEISTALDGARERQIMDLLDERRAARGMALVVISHDLPLVLDRAEHVIVLERGTVADAGPPARLRADPAPATRTLLAAGGLLGAATAGRPATD